jgi:hypothetical protein
MVLPADVLASIILDVALIAILSDALITELSLGAIAVAGKLALPFAAGPTAVVSSVLNPGTLAARSPLVIRVVTVTALSTFVPVHAASVVMVMVVACHLKKAPFVVRRVVILWSHRHRTPYLKGRKGCAMKTCWC